MTSTLSIVLMGFFSSISTSYILDNIFKRIVKDNARYFLLHVCLNSYVVLTTYDDMTRFFLNPQVDFSQYTKSSLDSASVCIGFHMYHYLTEDLDCETKIHHIVTVFITGSTALLIPTGSTTSAINFIMCGLPGGIDYFMLVLCRYNLMKSITEKYINRWLNLLIRMPGMMLITWYIVLNIYNGNIIWKSYILTICACLLMTINSIYYCNKTVGNYHVRNYQQNIHKNS